MSGVAYFFKPKITANDSNSSSTTEKRPARRTKHVKSSEIPIPNELEPQPMEAEAPLPETKIIHVEEEQQQQPEAQTPTPKIKLKFTLRSQSIHDSTSDERIITNVTHERSNVSDDESSDNETRLKIDDNQDNFDDDDGGEEEEDEQIPIPIIVSPTKKKAQSSRKKVISHLIGSTANTLSLDEPSPIKLPANESQFSEIKQTKSGRTIKYTPYFKELVQGATISPPSSPVHTLTTKRPSSYSKKKQPSLKSDLDAIKNGGLPAASNAKSRKSGGSPKQKKQTTSPGKRSGQGRKSTVPRTPKAKRASNQIIMQEEEEEEQDDEQEDENEELDSDDENEVSQRQSDDEEFHQEGHSSEEEEEEGLDAEDDEQSSNGASDEEEWTGVNNKQDFDRTLGLAATLGSIPSGMLDGFSLWAMKYRARHKMMALDDKRLHRTWKKMSGHDRQRWCLKAEKENFHYPITAELLKSSSSSAAANDSSTAVKQPKTAKRKKANDDHPPILLQKTLNQYSKQQPSLSSIRPPNSFVKQPTTPTIVAPPKNYDIVDIAAGIYLLGESLTKMGEKVRQLGHLNPRGQSAATAIDNLSAILFDGTLCACNLMACLGNEIISTNPPTSKSDPLTNKLMENVGIILPGLS